jgi:hypothetical protein
MSSRAEKAAPSLVRGLAAVRCRRGPRAGSRRKRSGTPASLRSPPPRNGRSWPAAYWSNLEACRPVTSLSFPGSGPRLEGRLSRRPRSNASQRRRCPRGSRAVSVSLSYSARMEAVGPTPTSVRTLVAATLASASWTSRGQRPWMRPRPDISPCGARHPGRGTGQSLARAAVPRRCPRPLGSSSSYQPPVRVKVTCVTPLGEEMASTS